MQYEGEAEILGKPLDKKNKAFLNLFDRKLAKAFVDTFSKIPEMVLVKICPKTIVNLKQSTVDSIFKKWILKIEEYFR